jgi:hypothetical protein
MYVFQQFQDFCPEFGLFLNVSIRVARVEHYNLAAPVRVSYIHGNGPMPEQLKSKSTKIFLKY